MRAVIQRVSSASVSVDGSITGSISAGLVVLVGIEPADTESDGEWLAGKICRLRLFADSAAPSNRSLVDVSGEMLVISQFTLFGSVEKGNRPSFHRAARSETARPVYEQFLQQCAAALGREIQKGLFGADMKVSLVNDGPVTLILDSKNCD